MCLELNIMDNVNNIEDNLKYKFILKIENKSVYMYLLKVFK